MTHVGSFIKSRSCSLTDKTSRIARHESLAVASLTEGGSVGVARAEAAVAEAGTPGAAETIGAVAVAGEGEGWNEWDGGKG